MPLRHALEGPDGSPLAMHGADIFTLRHGKIAEKLTYATI